MNPEMKKIETMTVFTPMTYAGKEHLGARFSEPMLKKGERLIKAQMELNKKQGWRKRFPGADLFKSKVGHEMLQIAFENLLRQNFVEFQAADPLCTDHRDVRQDIMVPRDRPGNVTVGIKGMVRDSLEEFWRNVPSLMYPHKSHIQVQKSKILGYPTYVLQGLVNLERRFLYFFGYLESDFIRSNSVIKELHGQSCHVYSPYHSKPTMELVSRLYSFTRKVDKHEQEAGLFSHGNAETEEAGPVRLT